MSDHQSNALQTDLLIEQWPIERPKPYARNARKITDKAVDKVAASIREFGFRQPIVVDQDGVVIVGHARLLAAQRLKLATVPVHVASTLTPAQVKAYRLADNRTNEETDWDLKLLAIEFADLKSLDLDLSLTGFDPDELELTDPVEQPRDEKGRFSNKKTEQPATGQDPVPAALFQDAVYAISLEGVYVNRELVSFDRLTPELCDRLNERLVYSGTTPAE